MASGSFHGGGFHSGGHHSGGGGFGGGFGGGGFHSSGGGGFHSSGGGFHSGGGYHGGHHSSGGSYFNGDDEYYVDNDQYVFQTMFYMGAAAVVGAAIVVGFLGMLILQGDIPGLNFVNLGIFCISAFIYFMTLKETGRTSDIYYFDYIELNRVGGRVWKIIGSSRPADAIGDKRTWASKETCQYSISFFDREFGVENANKVYEAKKRTPKIVWMKTKVWGTLMLISFIANFFFYEAVIDVFENMIMTDIAFFFIDEVVFYFMSVLSLLFSIAALVCINARDRILHECALRIVEDNMAYEERNKTEQFIHSQLSKKWYYNRCPNCDAESTRALTYCLSCGTSLEVPSFADTVPGSVHRISTFDPKKHKPKPAAKEKA